MDRLIKNISDQIKEAQIKLGYVRETVRLYYPLSSLNALMNTQIENADEMQKYLRKRVASDMCQMHYPAFGKIVVGMHGGRIEVNVPPEGVAYVHDEMGDSPFLRDIIELFQRHHSCSLEEICKIFEKYSKDFVCRKMPEGADFDYVIYFEDLSVDEYYYCIKMEMGHTIYHRFMKEDYEIL
jgi:hypothetical protein